MNKQARNAAKLLPKPIKLLKRLAPGDIVAVIRRGRDFCKASLPKRALKI